MRHGEMEELLTLGEGETAGPEILARLSDFNAKLLHCLSGGSGPPMMELASLLEDAANRYLDFAGEMPRAFPAYRAVYEGTQYWQVIS
jgi:hypothetical protein